MRLIDADALMDYLQTIPIDLGYRGIEDVKRFVNKMPTIEERKIGRWIEVEEFYNRISGRCSACGWESHMYEDDVVGMDYCPNCGARLVEKGEDV